MLGVHWLYKLPRMSAINKITRRLTHMLFISIRKKQASFSKTVGLHVSSCSVLLFTPSSYKIARYFLQPDHLFLYWASIFYFVIVQDRQSPRPTVLPFTNSVILALGYFITMFYHIKYLWRDFHSYASDYRGASEWNPVVICATRDELLATGKVLHLSDRAH